MTITQEVTAAGGAERLAGTAAANRAALQGSLAALHPGGRPGRTAAGAGAVTAGPGTDRADAALAAYRDLAPALGRTAPDEVPSTVLTARDPLIALLRHQGIRWRQITLPDDGSGQGHGDFAGTTGPMIGFTADGGQPVAVPPRAAAHGGARTPRSPAARTCSTGRCPPGPRRPPHCCGSRCPHPAPAGTSCCSPRPAWCRPYSGWPSR